nr:dihydroorotate dehydrogenase (quinone), mitochondrial-like [Cherax quadricarinatus]
MEMKEIVEKYESGVHMAELERLWSNRIDGLIVSNTTVTRPLWLESAERQEVGGLSGQPLKSLATHTVTDMYRLTRVYVKLANYPQQDYTYHCVGGVASGQDAYEKICAGASLVQVYTGLVYHGPLLVHRITNELEDLLRVTGSWQCFHMQFNFCQLHASISRLHGFSTVTEAVGVDCKQ